MSDELEKLKAEISRLRAELESREAEMDDERRAMMFMLEDTNRSVEEMEKAQAKLREEVEVTTNLLMIAEATARVTDMGGLRKEGDGAFPQDRDDTGDARDRQEHPLNPGATGDS